MAGISRLGFFVTYPFVVTRPIRGELVEPQAPSTGSGQRRYASIASFACSYNCQSSLIESFICYYNCQSSLIESFICYCNCQSSLIKSFICYCNCQSSLIKSFIGYCNDESQQCVDHNKPCVRLRFANRTYKSSWSGGLSPTQCIANQH